MNLFLALILSLGRSLLTNCLIESSHAAQMEIPINASMENALDLENNAESINPGNHSFPSDDMPIAWATSPRKEWRCPRLYKQEEIFRSSSFIICETLQRVWFTLKASLSKLQLIARISSTICFGQKFDIFSQQSKRTTQINWIRYNQKKMQDPYLLGELFKGPPCSEPRKRTESWVVLRKLTTFWSNVQWLQAGFAKNWVRMDTA